MDGTGDAAWANAHQFHGADQDFNSLLNLDLDLDFPHHQQQQQQGQGQDGTQNTYDDLANSFDTQHFFSPQVLPEQHHGGQHHYQLQQQQQANGGMTQPTDMFGNSIQQYDNHHMGNYHMHAGIPPTPNSAELHANAAQYLQQKRVQIAGQGYYPHKDDGSFTPLVSPAVTPNDIMHSGPDFSVTPGAYFSPLVSPALGAQNHPLVQMQAGQCNGSGSSTEASPTVPNVNLNGDSFMAPPEQAKRNTARSTKRGAPGSNASTLLGKASVQKSTRRKVTASGIMSKGSSESPTSSHGQALGSMLSTAQTRGGNGNSHSVSTSPEPMSQMGPPPKPGSVLHSPDPFGHGFHSPALPSQSGGMTPPTPAGGFQHALGFAGFPMLEDLSLPEASLAKTPLPRSDSAILDNSGSVEPHKARKLSVNTPSASGVLSAKPSPMLSAVNSPTSPAFTTGMKRPESKLARNSKKRGSVSTAPSPAIRPKISPNIKPLIAQHGASNSPDDHARLLATRSNYQNIIDGTNVPGLNYPTSLSANLTQKKQSHKVAEQHRRNRLNVALAQLDALLPGSPKILAKDAANGKNGNGIKTEGNGSGSPEGEETTGGAVGNSASSKAEKVEMAVKYIQELRNRIEALEKERSSGSKEREGERMQVDEVNGKEEASQGEAEARSTSEASRSPD